MKWLVIDNTSTEAYWIEKQSYTEVYEWASKCWKQFSIFNEKDIEVVTDEVTKRLIKDNGKE